MKKMKKLIFSGLMVMITFITFGIVDAKEYTSVEEMLNDLPNTITLDINDTDLFKNTNGAFYSEFGEQLEKAQEKIATQYGLADVVTIGGLKYRWQILQDLDTDQIREAEILIFKEGEYDGVSKKIKVQYANESKYNATDEAYVKNIMKGKSFFAWLSIKNKDDETIKKNYSSYVTRVINNSSVKITPICFGYRGYGSLEAMYIETVFGVVRNGVVYDTVYGEVDIYKEITIPNSTKDTEKAYLDYALPLLKRDFKVNITKASYKGNSMYEIFYTTEDDYTESEYVLIRKNNVTRVMDNVVLDTFDVIPTGTLLSNTSQTYKDMNTKMNSRGYNSFVAYDLKITSGSLSSKSNLTIYIDSKYNGKNVLILIKNGNSYQELATTVKDGKVTVGVYNLAPIMIGVAKNTPITSVKINQSSLTLITGKTSKLTATINPSNTTQSKTLTWTSSNTKIATVDKNGVVKGIKA
ncbi:MAG: Ig-like domain-containing protein, partial [Bacilli bacterium]|nr:Ig-like domain-containing protein [Bacilli bacterium]